MSKPLFSPKDLRSLKDLHAEGHLRWHIKICDRMMKAGDLPGVKIGNSWYSTEAAIRSFTWKMCNKALQQSHA